MVVSSLDIRKLGQLAYVPLERDRACSSYTSTTKCYNHSKSAINTSMVIKPMHYLFPTFNPCAFSLLLFDQAWCHTMSLSLPRTIFFL